MSSRQINPMAMAFNILDEYKNNVCSTLELAGCNEEQFADRTEELRKKILENLYSETVAYLSLNRSYKRHSGTFETFCIERQLHDSLRTMFPNFKTENLYIHQAQAIDSILADKTTIISTGTGSGKTESFLIPLLNHCLNAKGTPGIKAIILYPMNALASDQLRRIGEAVKEHRVSVGSFIGSTSQEQRNTLIACPPDILITNYVMLDRLITKERTRSMFVLSAATLRYLVVDEIHSYRGTKGANLCLLLRRLRTFCSDSGHLVQIGASATLRQGGGYYSDEDQSQIQTYVRSLFGQEAAERFEFILPVYDDEDQGNEQESDLLSKTDYINGDPLVIYTDTDAVRKLADQLAGMPLPSFHPGRGEPDPLYEFAKRNQFIQAMRSLLKQQACTIDDLTLLFRRLYVEIYKREPRDPKGVVYAYLSVVNELNGRFSNPPRPAIPDVIIDYRLHLILNDLGGNLTCCLLCGQYHDGLKTHCRLCNGLLFPVSQQNLHLCLARCDGSRLSPYAKQFSETTHHSFPVLIERVTGQEGAMHASGPYFRLEPELDAAEENEYYVIYPAPPEMSNVRIIWSDDKKVFDPLELAKPRLYWQNIQKVVDAVLIRPQTQIAKKMLGFIDNREKASSIRFRLRDEIAERALTSWAAKQWSAVGTLPLLSAYRRLENQVHSELTEFDEPEEVLLHEIKQEMVFWFARMLTQLEEYDDMWHVHLSNDISQTLQEQEHYLIHEVFLPQCAIDRAGFGTPGIDKLKHFFLEKYRVSTEYGIGTKSAKERGYDVVSLGEQGRIYQRVVEQIGRERIEPLLSSLAMNGVLVRKMTPGGMVFYQLSPQHLTLECKPRRTDFSEYLPAQIECHTADNTNEERAESEEKFRSGKIQALICTPTLEMGVDIGQLSCVAMIGFPPSPASYAQRAGRAGRSSSLRSAIMIVLASSGNSHDDYYMADPRKIIEGTITPPQFTLANRALVASHIYAYILAGDSNFQLLKSAQKLKNRLRQCIAADELMLRTELGADYEQLPDYLYTNIEKWIGKVDDHERGYRVGLFPDYGFRRDGVPLVDVDRFHAGAMDEDGILTVREPEEAVRKLVPGRIVYCSGRPIRVATQQPSETYSVAYDATRKPFRDYSYFIAEEKDDHYVYAKRESDARYLLTKTLFSATPVEEPSPPGRGYCRIQLVRQGKIYILNEGKFDALASGPEPGSIVPFQDEHGEYRIGTCIVRDGLLIRLAEQILPLNTTANFLATLLRSIPDYFNLDDGELRVISNITLSPMNEETISKQKVLFLYGHDESGLVPFDKIFVRLTEMLEKHLQVLETCSCHDGCYRCLFSFNSRYLTGMLSRRGATQFLRAFLGFSLLRPSMPHFTPATSQPDVVLRVEWRGRCEISAENYRADQKTVYHSDSLKSDQNTAIYTAMNNALLAELAKGGRTVKLFCKLEYMVDHLQGKTDVKKGQEAFMRLLLTLRSWDAWSVERSK